MPPPRLDGRRVLVTGAASGIGLATCRRLARDGAAVAGIDLDGPRLEAMRSSLESQSSQEGGPVEVGPVEGRPVVVATAVADVADPEQVHAAVAEVAAGLGGLDGVVTCAGGGGYSGDVGDTSVAHWQRTLAVNLTGTFLVCHEAVPLLKAAGSTTARGGAGIVTVSSQYGLVGCAEDPSYCAAKAGVIGLTRAMAVDLGPASIRVNCVAPGPIATPALAATRERTRREGVGGREAERVAHRLALGRPGQAEDVAATITFLLSDDAANTTGSVLGVDGGWVAG